MKKLLLIVLVLAMMLGIIESVSAFEFSPNFNAESFENLPGYSFDAFDKTWSYKTSFNFDYNEFKVTIIFSVYGSSSEVVPPSLYMLILEDGKHRPAKQLKVIANDKIYSFNLERAEKLLKIDNTEFSTVQIGKIGKQMLLHILQTKSMALKISLSSFISMTADVGDINTVILPVKLWIASLDSLNYWDSFDNVDILDGFDNTYAASVE